MAILRDENGNPIPQYQTSTPNVFEAAKGSGGAIDVNVKTPLPTGTNIIGKVGIDPAANTVKDNDAGNGATGVTAPTGGTGKLGWLSGIYDRLSKVVLAAGSAIIGKVGIDQTAGQNVVSFGTVSQPVKVTDSMPFQTFVEQKTQANAVAGVLTFSTNIAAIEIYNTDPINVGVFTVNGLPITVPPGKTFMSPMGGNASTTVFVTGATSYIVSRYI